MIETTVNIAGIDLEVWFEYTPRDVEDPIYYGAVIEVIALRLGDVDILPIINEELIAEVEQQIEDQHDNQEEMI